MVKPKYKETLPPQCCSVPEEDFRSLVEISGSSTRNIEGSANGRKDERGYPSPSPEHHNVLLSDGFVVENSGFFTFIAGNGGLKSDNGGCAAELTEDASSKGLISDSALAVNGRSFSPDIRRQLVRVP